MRFGAKPKRDLVRCEKCGRADIANPGSVNTPFHYAPEPCGMPCSGGQIPPEERGHWKATHGVDCECQKAKGA